MIGFLEKQIKRAGHKMIVIADEHPVHRGRQLLKGLLESRKSKMKFVLFCRSETG